MKHRVEAILATAATSGNWVVHTHELLQLGISILTLLWWVRLWFTNRKDPKP